MSWTAPARCALWCFVVSLAASCVGCPELNQWSGPGYLNDPFLNSSIPQGGERHWVDQQSYAAAHPANPASSPDADAAAEVDSAPQVASLQK